jgi:hypothetical protein
MAGPGVGTGEHSRAIVEPVIIAKTHWAPLATHHGASTIRRLVASASLGFVVEGAMKAL